MLHNIVDGPCSESFGIHVAQMAGFPSSVIKEAKRKAAELEHQGEGAVVGALLNVNNIYFAYIAIIYELLFLKLIGRSLQNTKDQRDT